MWRQQPGTVRISMLLWNMIIFLPVSSIRRRAVNWVCRILKNFADYTAVGRRKDMFTKRIIPCLDVNNGRVVKGVNFVNLKDAGDPVEIAAAYDAGRCG